MQVEPTLHPPEVELTEDEATDLLARCHMWMELVLERNLPKYLQSEGLRLLKELDEAQGWYELH